MITTTYASGELFLRKASPFLEANEAANNLILGLAFRIREDLQTFDFSPYLCLIEDKEGLALAALMTPPHWLILTSDRKDSDPVINALVRNLSLGKHEIPGILGPVTLAERFAEVWAKTTGNPYYLNRRERIYDLKTVISPRMAPGHIRLATSADQALAIEWTFAIRKEIQEGDSWEEASRIAVEKIARQELYLWEDQEPVSMAAKTRPTRHGSCIGLVYTPPEERGRGYASNCVARLSQIILDEGKHFCALFTDLANPVSNHIYQEIGYRPVCDVHQYVFGQIPEG